MNIIKREIYTKKIKPFIQKNIIKVIVGQRRVGKSCFLQQIAQQYQTDFPNIPMIYINMEDFSFENLKDCKQLVSYAEEIKGIQKKAAIFIDEIQEIQEFEKALRHFQTKDEWDIYCTGSNAALLSGELATLLSGRYIEINMYGLSYCEFLLFHNLQETKENFNKYLKFGGLPFLNHLELDEIIAFDLLKSIYSTILFKDIISRHNIRNVAFLEKLTYFISDNIGNPVSARKISEFLKSQNQTISTNIILDYLEYLKNAFFIYKVPRYDLKGKKLLEIYEKYYLEDMGIRHAMIGFRQNDIAQIFENTVFKHLLICGYNVTTGRFGDKEIDFICTKGGKIIYIQVTLSLADEQVKTREFGNLLSLNDNYRKIVITGDDYMIDSHKGIEIMNIREFLIKFE